MPQFKVQVTFTSTGHFIINAESQEEAWQIANNGVGAIINVDGRDAEDWEFPVHMDKEIVLIEEISHSRQIDENEMSFEEFEEKFKPIEINGDFFIDTEDHVFLTRKAWVKNRLWTLIEEDGESFLVPRKQFVNRLNYVITEVAYEDDSEIIVNY